jgi:hypothetical protein
MSTKIDLKYADITITDGGDNYTLTGLINNVAGYAINATTLLVDNIVGAVDTGGQLVIGANKYTILSHIETTGNTTSVTIAAPGLIVAVTDNQAISFTGKINSLTVKVGEGNLTFSEKRNMEYILDRGRLDDVREGDQVPMDVSMQFVWDYIKGTGVLPSVRDALKQQGAASTWRSSDPDTCRPYAVNIQIFYSPNCSGTDKEKIALEDFRWEEFSPDLRNGQISVSGKCNQTQATITRSTTVTAVGVN